MKKNLFLFLFYTCVLIPINAQFSTNDVSVKATQIGETLTGIDELIVFDGILLATSITYTHPTATTFKWYRYTTNPSINDELKVESVPAFSTTLDIVSNSASLGYFGNGDDCGYMLEYDDGGTLKYKHIWVLDMANNLLTFDPLVADTVGVDPCINTHLTAVIKGPPPSFKPQLEYRDSLGVLNYISRKYTVTYYSLDSLAKHITVNIEKTNLVQGTNDIFVPSPYKKTTFTISGDQFYNAFGKAKTITSPDFTPYAVQLNLKGVIAERTDLNEKERSKGVLGGSAPLVVDFSSNTNVPVSEYFQWYIRNSKDSTDVAYYTDEDLRYTFKDAGLYSVKLVVSNSRCIATDSLDATVLASFLDVPNVFTPNGDGKNDEFRVAFSSIINFKGVIFNRWGRKIFEWTDPGKGWDGRIGRRIAQPGAYYYIIEAQGSDIDPITNKPMIYTRTGDINLLRGK